MLQKLGTWSVWNQVEQYIFSSSFFSGLSWLDLWVKVTQCTIMFPYSLMLIGFHSLYHLSRALRFQPTIITLFILLSRLSVSLCGPVGSTQPEIDHSVISGYMLLLLTRPLGTLSHWPVFVQTWKFLPCFSSWFSQIKASLSRSSVYCEQWKLFWFLSVTAAKHFITL